MLPGKSMKNLHRLIPALPFLAALAPGAELTVKATNPLHTEREVETLELTAAQLAPLGAADLRTIHVKDGSGNKVLCQAVDTDLDALHTPDIVVFQSSFGPGESKTFTVTTGEKQVYHKDDFKVFGRFNRERFDDFAWENDRIAHRTYGHALETWEGEPLISSTIDVWSKRTPKMVINDWYLADDYHADHGEGADLYSAGPTRGCGGSGIWADDRLWTSRNFVESRVLANGPIRLIFELDYEPWRVGDIAVAEVKRVTLDAGSQLNHIRSTFKQFTRPGQAVALTAGIGLKKVPGEVRASDPAAGWLAKWEPVSGNNGHQGLAVIVHPAGFQQAEDELNHLALSPVPVPGAVDYWTGFAWDKAGHITDFDAWKAYLADFVQRRDAPIELTISVR